MESSGNKICHLIIDGNEVSAREGQSILEAALAAGIYIPHLCFHPDLPSFERADSAETIYRGEQSFHSDNKASNYEGCGLCLVEVSGKEESLLSCVTQVEEGMEVTIFSDKLKSQRQDKLVSILTDHPHACLQCAQREGCSLTSCSTDVPEVERCCPIFAYCELRKVAEYVGIREDIARYKPRGLYEEKNKPLFIQDYNLCIGCLRCVRVCHNVIGAKSLDYVISDGRVIVGTAKPSLEESGCHFCGACVEVCPTGALRDKDLAPGDREAMLVPCSYTCPVGMDVPSYARFIALGNFQEASRIIRERVPLALTLGYICHHPCEAECRRGLVNESISICSLKRFALEEADARFQDQGKETTTGKGSRERGGEEKGAMKKDTGKKIAVIGSGPAGLVGAYFLNRMGHSVTVHEEMPEAGGLLRWAIPEFRLPRSIVQKEIKEIEAAGVEILTDSPASGEKIYSDFQKGHWDAIFLASGCQESKKIDVEGDSLDGIFWGLDFLKKVKEEKQEKLEGKVLIIGGGNVAVDTAMAALRMGAEKVEMACLEGREEMPAYSWEIQDAEEERIVIHAGWGPKKFIGDNGHIKGAELRGCTSVFDEQGNFSPKFDDSQSKSLEADSVILAVGQKADLSYLPSDLRSKISENGTIKANPDTLATSVAGIYAGGEAVLGPSSAVEAMAMGRKAASSIDKFLGGEGLKEERTALPIVEKSDLWMGYEENFSAKERIDESKLPASERSQTFDLIHLGLKNEEARREASRCLRCNVRLYLSPPTLPPEKWMELTAENISGVPETEGAFQLLDLEKKIISIKGVSNLKQALEEQLSSNEKARYFGYDEDPMYTKRESELIQQFLQEHGHLPSESEDVDDLF